MPDILHMERVLQRVLQVTNKVVFTNAGNRIQRNVSLPTNGKSLKLRLFLQRLMVVKLQLVRRESLQLVGKQRLTEVKVK